MNLYFALTPSAVGQTRVADHIGFVLPLVTQSDRKRRTGIFIWLN
jgi:hypothetical protein